MRARDAAAMLRPGRLPRLVVAMTALLAGTVLGVTETMAVLATSADREATAIELTDDDGARALFTVDGMAPGHPVAQCVTVRHRADGSAALRLHGLSEGNGLERGLGLVVDMGAGGAFNDCAGFRGRRVYDGTLEDFAGVHADFASGLSLLAAIPDGSTSFRFTVEVLDDDTVQGKEAQALFTWEAQPVPPTTTTVPPTTIPTEAPVATEAPVPGAALAFESTDPDRGPSGSGTDGSPEEAANGGTEKEARAAEGETAQGRARFRSVGGDGSSPDRAARVAALVLQAAAFPLVLLLIAALFLLVQDRLDRRDPKLALAPLYPDPDLRFEATGKGQP